MNFSADGNDALTAARGRALPRTPSGRERRACVDYVQSNRDGSGDTHLYVLFGQDARVSVR